MRAALTVLCDGRCAHSCGITLSGDAYGSTRSDSCAMRPILARGACSRSPLAALRTAYCHTLSVPLATSALATAPASLPPSAASSSADRPMVTSSFTEITLNRLVIAGSFVCAKADTVEAAITSAAVASRLLRAMDVMKSPWGRADEIMRPDGRTGWSRDTADRFTAHCHQAARRASLTSGGDLTFATRLSAGSQSECQNPERTTRSK